jgi:glycosyltransferase involved in cell wall biosynthesis
VVNDGSTDGTRELLQGMSDPRLKVIHQANGGIARALNAGFASATSDLLTWTSDDNAYLPGALEAMARELHLDPQTDLVFADYLAVRDDESSTVVHAGPLSELADRNVVGACFLYRRALAERVGEYDPERDLAEDYDWWLRANRTGRLRHLPRVLYLYRDHAGNLTHQRFAEVQAATMALQPPADPEVLRAQLARLSASYKQQGMPLRSLQTAARLVKRAPWSGSSWWAVARALMPMPLLRLTRRLRGLTDA